MLNYDFSALNDKEFENLCIDLISSDNGKRFERFKTGKDGGIDGRFCNDDGTQEVIQCKHYSKTGFKGLISSLKKKNNKGINEIKKVKILNPFKYIFATSVQLSANNKKEIKELFSPYIKSESDIFGLEDLNQLLGNNYEIEKQYSKLWLNSINALEKFINVQKDKNSAHSKEYLEDLSSLNTLFEYMPITSFRNMAFELPNKINTSFHASDIYKDFCIDNPHRHPFWDNKLDILWRNFLNKLDLINNWMSGTITNGDNKLITENEMINNLNSIRPGYIVYQLCDYDYNYLVLNKKFLTREQIQIVTKEVSILQQQFIYAHTALINYIRLNFKEIVW